MLSANQPISENLPAHGCRHVAIIMDGNGRWAKRQGKIRAFGHRAGAKSVRRAVSFAANSGIGALTLYAFSSENWNRPAQEVSALMEFFGKALALFLALQISTRMIVTANHWLNTQSP